MIDRLVSIYPGRRNAGVALWAFVDGDLAAVAVGVVPLAGLPALLRRYRPGTAVLESRRRGGPKAAPVSLEAVERVIWADPAWRRHENYPAQLGRSVLLRRAFAIGYHTIFRRTRLRLGGKLPLDSIHDAWLDRWSPGGTR